MLFSKNLLLFKNGHNFVRIIGTYNYLIIRFAAEFKNISLN